MEVNGLGQGSESSQVRSLANLWVAIRPMVLDRCPAGSGPVTMTDRRGETHEVATNEIAAPFDEIMGEMRVRRLHLDKHFAIAPALPETSITLARLALREQFDDRLWAVGATLGVQTEYRGSSQPPDAHVTLRVADTHTFYMIAELLPDTHADLAEWLTAAGDLGLCRHDVANLLCDTIAPLRFMHGQLVDVDAAVIDRVLTRIEGLPA